MADAPFFSIVTAIRDGLYFFKKTAPTILNQTFTNWEWLIVDDCSAEDIGSYIRSFNDPRIRYFRNETSRGQTRSLNDAIHQSQSNWIVRMDGDDLAHLERLDLTYKKIQSEKFSPLLFSDYEVIAEDGALITIVKYTSPLPSGFYDYLEKNNPICHPTVTFYKYAPDQKVNLFDETLVNAQDYALWRSIYEKYKLTFLHIDVPLVGYRLVKQSLSGARAQEQKAELKSIRENEARKSDLGLASKTLSHEQQVGMYAYRELYYRFVGSNSSSSHLQLLLQAARYRPVLLKSAFYFFCRPLNASLKKILFKDIYQ